MYIHQKIKFLSKNHVIAILFSCKMQVSVKNLYNSSETLAKRFFMFFHVLNESKLKVLFSLNITKLHRSVVHLEMKEQRKFLHRQNWTLMIS